MRFAAALTTLVLVAGFAVAEDKVTFKDGKVVTGEILAVTTGDIQIRTDAEKIRVPRAVIEKVERDGKLLDLDSENAVPVRPRPPQPVARGRTFEATPALLAWLDICAGQLAADDQGVRAGATAALLSAGTLAIPALEQASERDERIAPTANRVIAQIKRKEQRMPPPAKKAEAPASR